VVLAPDDKVAPLAGFAVDWDPEERLVVWVMGRLCISVIVLVGCH